MTRMAVIAAVAGVAGLVLFTTDTGKALSAPYYDSCREAIIVGAAPIGRGEPGYRPALDADNDGIACEPYRRR